MDTITKLHDNLTHIMINAIALCMLGCWCSLYTVKFRQKCLPSGAADGKRRARRSSYISCASCL